MVWQFDVGQGDCAWIEFPDGWSCLVDTGPPGRGGDGAFARDLRPFLRRCRLGDLDLVLLTHGHDDHTGGAEDLAASMPVAAWSVGGRATAPGAVTGFEPMPGDTLHAFGPWALVFLGPDPAASPLHGENDASLSVGFCRAGLLRGLWTGDLETAGEAALLPLLPRVPDGGVDVWKAGHHGSRTSGSPALLAAIRPRLVLVSCGVVYPDARILRTDLSGSIRVTWNRDGQCRAQPVRENSSGPP